MAKKLHDVLKAHPAHLHGYIQQVHDDVKATSNQTADGRLRAFVQSEIGILQGMLDANAPMSHFVDGLKGLALELPTITSWIGSGISD